MDKYLEDDEFEYSTITRPKKPRKQQTQMDEFLFKSRRIDKGSREFGLKTIHEPKRGSKKKRESTDALEIDVVDVEEFVKKKKIKLEKEEEIEKKRRHEDWRNSRDSNRNFDDDLDYSLAFQSPSPRRAKGKRNTKITKFMASTSSSKPPNPRLPSSSSSCSSPFPYRFKFQPVSSNDPSTYASTSSADDLLNSTLDSTIQNTPPRPLMETMPMCTPSPAKRKYREEKVEKTEEIVPESPIFKKSTMKNYGNDNQNLEDYQQNVQAWKPKGMGKRFIPPLKPYLPSTSSSAPEASQDDDVEILEKRRHHRDALSAEETKREEFGRHAADRQKMLRNLIDNEFLMDRNNGGIEKRKAELKDGQVIRNKEMRKNLMHGAACKCCRGYYDGLDMAENEKMQYIDKVSRHRYVHQPLPDTPPRYWDLTLGPCDEMEKVLEENRNWETTSTKKTKKKGGEIENWG